MSAFYTHGQGVIIATRGPGKLHLLSYASNANLPSVVGSIATTSPGLTRFLVGHSYFYVRFAFIWDGAGDAVCGKGPELARQPVGRSWDAATGADWETAVFTTQNVQAVAGAATVKDELVSCFIIPDNLL